MQNSEIELNIGRRNSSIKAAFFSYCLAILAILLVRDVMGINMSKWIVLAVCVLPYIIFDLSYAMAFTIFLLPLNNGLPFNYICLVGLIITVVKYLNKLALNNRIIIILLIFLIELVSAFFGRFILTDYLRFIGPFLLISLFIFKNQDNDMDYEAMIISYILGAIGGELIYIINTINMFGIQSILSAGSRLGDTSIVINDQIMRLTYDPNGLGRHCAYAIGALLVLLDKSKISKTLLMVIIISQTIIGSMTLSRYFLLLMVIIVLLYLLSKAESAKQFLKGTLVLVVVIIGIYASANQFAPNVVEGYSARGFSEKQLSNGRIEIGKAYFDSIEQNPQRLFLGVGLQNYQEKAGVFASCHSGPQEVLITWGVIGLFLVTLYIWGLFKHGWRGVPPAERKIIYLLPLIVFLVGIQSGQFFSTHEELWLILPYSVMRLAQFYSPSSVVE